ncbi:MAG: SDR family NAD(P)-dependent oxidoreductase [Xanthobacteraceae bacterium]
MRFLVTGAAGFIGFHLARRLLTEGHTVYGLDGFTPYYDQTLKRRRHELLAEHSQFTGRELMLEDAARLADCVGAAAADVVIHLAAQAGVRYSAENPRAYIDSNIVGSFHLFEAMKQHRCRHLIVASTSSVYGANVEQPFHEGQPTDRPLSLYAATKRAVEALAHSHAYQFHLPTTVVRFFTVFGPWGRPDMAFFKFTKNIIEGRSIDVYGFGNMTRDFTYVDDVVEAVRRLTDRPPAPDDPDIATPAGPGVPCRIVNIGCGQPVGLEDFIRVIETEIGRKAIRRELPMQTGDMAATWADTSRLERLTGFRPSTPLARGIHEFVAWYRNYYCL